MNKSFDKLSLRELWDEGYKTAHQWLVMPFNSNTPSFLLGNKPPKGYLKYLKLL